MKETIDKNSKKSPVIVNDRSTPKNSICVVMKDYTVDVIQKLESEMPTIFQNYSDLYIRYLHSIQDIFGTCSLAEKQYFDKMDIDQNTLKMYDLFKEKSKQ